MSHNTSTKPDICKIISQHVGRCYYHTFRGYPAAGQGQYRFNSPTRASQSIASRCAESWWLPSDHGIETNSPGLLIIWQSGRVTGL